MTKQKSINFISKIFTGENQNESTLHQFRLKKFRQVLNACLVCMLPLTIHFLFVDKADTAIIILIMMATLLVCYFIAANKSIQLGSSLFLITVTIVCCLFMWRNEGLTDESLLTFPGILIFAIIVASFRLAFCLLIIMIVNIFLIAYVNHVGIYVNIPNQSNFDTAIVLVSILVLITFSVFLLSRDTALLLEKLNLEVYKVEQSKQEVIRLQNHDPLTGLPNRILAKEIFKHHLKMGLRKDFEISLMFIDLDNFKSINDTLGHAVGDEILIEVASRLSAVVRDSDTVCRFGGDEFVIVALHDANAHSHSVLAEKLKKSVSEPIELDGKQVYLTASIGIAIAPCDGIDFDELNQKADYAMYSIKESGRNNYQYFNEKMTNDNARELNIAQNLKTALQENQLDLHFQTKQSLLDNKVTGAEALLRWHHPNLGTISPTEFIPIAEKSGVINEIGKWVLNEALAACRQWHDCGYNEMTIAVNVSSIQLKRGGFDKIVNEALSSHKLNGKHLILELTESILLESSNELSICIGNIKALGVRLAIDDFGTGYSNLGYLHKLDISSLKIDRSFIEKMNNSRQDLAIVEAIINMSKILEMDVVAEGIETEQTKNTLSQLGCTKGQGFYWTRAMNKRDFLDYLKQANSVY